MSILIPGMKMPTSCEDCPMCHSNAEYDYAYCCVSSANTSGNKIPSDCPLIPVTEHGGLFDVGQFEKGCFYGYGHDGKVYKLLWDIKVFDGTKKFYINPIIPADKEGEE